MTPLKDRIGWVIRTHYPETIDEGIQIAEQNAWLDRDGDGVGSGVRVDVPRFMKEIVEEVVRLARIEPARQPGVGRVGAHEHRQPRNRRQQRRAPRHRHRREARRAAHLRSELPVASCRGKIEMTLAEEEGAEDKLIQLAGRRSGEERLRPRTPTPTTTSTITEQFQGNLTFPAGDDLSADEFVANMKADQRPATRPPQRWRKEMELDGGDPATLASVGEFLLEGLYVNNRLSKYNSKGKTFFKK